MLIKIFDFFLNSYFFFFLGLFLTDYSFILLLLRKYLPFLPTDISNISLQLPILIILLSIRYILDRASFSGIKCIRLAKRVWNLPEKKILLGLFIIFFLIFTGIGIARHYALSSSGCDLAVSDQAIWNTTKGNPLFCSLDGEINHLGSHFEPILFSIVPFYFFWPNIIVLIVLQSLALGLAIWPLYFIAKNRLNNRLLIFAFILAYFLSRAVRGIGLLDFHTDSFLVPLTLVSFYLLVKKRIRLFLLALFFMLLCKEDATFIAAGFGIFSFLILKRYLLGLFLLAVGITGWIVETNIIMPIFSHTQGYVNLAWLPFGETYAENIKVVVNNPRLIGELFFNPKNIEFYLRLFAPLGFLSFLAPGHCLLFLLPLLEHIIGSRNHPGMQTISSHYPAHTLPFIFIAAIYGAGWLIDKLSRKALLGKGTNRKVAVILAIYITITSVSFYGKTDGHKLAKFLKSIKEMHSFGIISSLEMIPKEASVIAVNNLVPHLSHRKYIYMWQGLKEADYNSEYIVLHKKLFDIPTKDTFEQTLAVVAQKGYKEVFSDPDKVFHIFFNPKIQRPLLDRQRGKVIPVGMYL